MVLKQGRSFDQIAALLGMDRAGVRQRALEGFDALGPDTTLEPLKRALITDYLLGQLPAAVAQNVASSLAQSPAERAWARIIGAEISPLAAQGLPEIPAAGSKPAAPAAAAAPVPDWVEEQAEDATEAETARTPARSRPAAAPASAAAAPLASGATAHTGGSGDAPRTSRRGGAILIGVITIVVVVVVVILVATGGSKKKAPTGSTGTGSTPSASVSSTTGNSGTATTGTGTGTSTVVTKNKILMSSPSGSKTVQGAAAVVEEKGVLGLVIFGEGLPANDKNAYGVWLENSSSGKTEFLGFYGYKVAATGKTKGALEAEVKLPADATGYNELLLTLETQEKPTKPGQIVLEGAFSES